MERIDIIKLIDTALKDVDTYLDKNNISAKNGFYQDLNKVLGLLKAELTSDQKDFNDRVLRGFKDICTTVAIQYEHTSFSDSIFDINTQLELNIDYYSPLELLRMDFGKGNPI